MDKLLSHVIQRISETILQTDPFPHFFIEKIFPDEYYQELSETLPDPAYYLPSESNIQTWTFPLNDEALNQLPLGYMLFWMKFCQLLYSNSLMIAIMEKFQPHLKGQLQEIIEKKLLFQDCYLGKDKAGYSLGPHTDHPGRVASLLFYLPVSLTQEHLGTGLYRPKKEGFKCKGIHRYPFEDFKRIKKAPFLPNSVFGFFKTDDSFHGVEPIGRKEKERNLISYTIWKNLPA